MRKIYRYSTVWIAADFRCFPLYKGQPNVPGVFNMYGGEISGNKMTPYKGQHNTAAIDATRNNVNIYGGKICNNTAVGDGNVAHGVDVIWSDLTISGGNYRQQRLWRMDDE